MFAPRASAAAARAPPIKTKLAERRSLKGGRGCRARANAASSGATPPRRAPHHRGAGFGAGAKKNFQDAAANAIASPAVEEAVADADAAP